MSRECHRTVLGRMSAPVLHATPPHGECCCVLADARRLATGSEQTAPHSANVGVWWQLFSRVSPEHPVNPVDHTSVF